MMDLTTFEKLCEELELSDYGIPTICKHHGVSSETFYQAMKASEDCAKRYARAKSIQIEFLADKIHDLEDEVIQAVQNCDPKCSNALGQAYKLKIDNLKWLLSKLLPKKYGDRIDVAHSGNIDFAGGLTAARNRVENNGSK